MSFFVYDMGFLIIFGIALALFLIAKKKNLKRQGIMFLYKTKIGLKAIDYVGKHWGKVLKPLKYVVIGFGYFAMISMIYLLVKTAEIFFKSPDFVRLVKIPPLAPLIPYLPQIFKADYLPVFYFTYWIVILAVVAIVHEFAHGIFAKIGKIRIKSTGFYFMGPFIGAFVEQDDKQMIKASKTNQMALLAAGSFSNAVLTIIFFVIFWLFFSLVFSASGVVFNAYAYDVINKSQIESIGNNITVNFDGGLNLTEIKANGKTFFVTRNIIEKINEMNDSQMMLAFEDSPALREGLSGIIVKFDDIKINNYEDMKNALTNYKPEESVVITALNKEDNSEREYKIQLAENPKNKSSAFIGIAMIQQESSLLGKIRAKLIFFQNQNTYYAPKFAPELMIFIKYLLLWMILINFSVALGNMLPVGIFDGGRFFYLTMAAITGSEKLAKKLFKASTYIILGIFILLMVLWAAAIF